MRPMRWVATAMMKRVRGGRHAARMTIVPVATLAAASIAAAAAAPLSRPDSAGGWNTSNDIARSEPVAHKDEQLAQNTAPQPGSATGTHAGTIGRAQLKALVPEKIGAWRRRTLESPLRGAMAVPGDEVTAEFGRGNQRVKLTVTDLGSLDAAARAAQWTGAPVDRATDTGTEKIYREGSHTVREEFRRAGSQGEVTLILANGLAIGATGVGVDMTVLKQIALGVDRARAEALARPAK